MKKTFLLLLTVMLTFGMTLVSCSGDDEGPGITTQSYTITNTEDGDVVQGFGDGKLYTKIPYTIYTFKDGHKTENKADKKAKKYYVKDLNIDIKKIIAGAPVVIQDFEALENASSFKSADYGNGATEDNDTNLATLSLETDSTKYAKAVWANWGSGIVVPVDALSTRTDLIRSEGLVKG
ncbi:MAG: hypothetical protein LBE74_07310 [Treponema sp.]|jgi:hypothetical protein|nr:hypothetical protein [Treponema sp.]